MIATYLLCCGAFLALATVTYALTEEVTDEWGRTAARQREERAAFLASLMARAPHEPCAPVWEMPTSRPAGR